MAQPTTMKFGKVLLYIETPRGSGIYETSCGFTEMTFTVDRELGDTTVPDCDDPDAPAWVGRETRSQSWGISAQGILALEADELWREFLFSNDSRRVRWYKDGAIQKGYYEGLAHLQSYEEGATLGEKVTRSIEIQGDGAVIWYDV